MLLQQEHRQILAQRIDPKIILANTILQLTSLELTQSIENELLENPALETLEESFCNGNCLDPASCPSCAARRAREIDSRSLDIGYPEPDIETSFDTAAAEGDEYDFVGNLEAEMTVQEHLRGLMRAAVPSEDYGIGEYLINSLDERGWLDGTPESIAAEIGVDSERVRSLLTVLQSFDPPGIGARNLQECLLLQLCYLRDEESTPASQRTNAIAERLVREHFDLVGARRYQKLARVSGITTDEAKQAIEYICTRLHPSPASQFRPPWDYRPGNRSTVRPDVVIRRTDTGYEVEVLGAEPFALGINPSYRDAYNEIKNGRGRYSEEEKRHFTEYVERAELFLQNLTQRRKTLRMISECLIELQIGFLETGSRQFLRPLTRTRVAALLHVHESTVSRATANKFVQLPNQEVVPFEIFFNASLSIKDLIEAIIQEEDPANPLSDQQIADQLRERGVDVARRTIVKYRESQNILSSTRRRR